jgi:hypothetical protein
MRKLGIFEAMDRNGVSPGTNLEHEKLRRMFKDFIGTSIGRREGRGVGRIADKN